MLILEQSDFWNNSSFRAGFYKPMHIGIQTKADLIALCGFGFFRINAVFFLRPVAQS